MSSGQEGEGPDWDALFLLFAERYKWRPSEVLDLSLSYFLSVIEHVSKETEQNHVPISWNEALERMSRTSILRGRVARAADGSF